MKKLFIFLLIIGTGVIVLPVSCSKSISGRTDSLPPLDPQKTDIDAGDWKPILLTAPTDISVAAPSATTTPDYVAQVNEIKSWQQNLSGDEKRIVSYWAAGAVLRWNEILRQLVAKHNLAPYQNPDGTYPIPSAANPLAYPQFPFANPPYSSRAYAYVSAAQYDALVTAYYYKKLYNRPAPYHVDSSLKVLVAKTDLPSYPSEDATIVGATVELLKLLFPGDQEFIQQKAEEHKRARIISGANVRSDIEAGEALGKAVAQKFVTRARGDRAGAAVGTPTIWSQMEQDCIAKGETPWISQEVPKRPPQLPLFGKVKGFLIDSLAVIAMRPPAPPSTSSDQFKKETEEVLYYSQHFDKDRDRIVQFWADGVGTYTPPGHWNAIAADAFIQKDFSEVRWARNLALLNMAMMDAAICCWDAKFAYFNPRPSQVDPRIKTWTGLPNFPSYTSGHSTFSNAAATILGYIVPDQAAAFEDMATEASLSRLYGAIHYRSDIEVGTTVGKQIGQVAIARAQTDGAD